MQSFGEADQNGERETRQMNRSLTGPPAVIPAKERGVQSPRLSLALDAYAKARRARCGWQAARLAGDGQAAERARRLMLRHQVIAYHLDPNRGTK